MRLSIPGIPGVYYDTDSGTTAIGVAMTAAGRKAPKPKGYAVQLLPYLWSFEVDLREVPTDHPIQYLHPEGAQSLGELSPERGLQEAGTELESVLRFVWSVNQEVESATNRLIGRTEEHDGIVIEIQDGSVVVDGDDLETDAFDVDEDEVTDTDAFEDAEGFSSDEFDTGDEFDAGSDDVDPDEP
ncbi:hypothetical protein [Natronorubrum halophilum]|uniref:hypothetical protein n=1 Tax=Natronorubrum halophilum TaxID=1702106 RepID=UPI000EF6D957|nr:hypothetical protein [Natronorubrum halophilum]